MQSFPSYEVVRAVERDLDREHAELARQREAEGFQKPVRKRHRSPIAAMSAVVEWWFRPGETITS
jgi:hypothetical protein